MLKEACVESLQEALLAQQRGANRIELCADLGIGGITPSYALIESAKKLLNIPVMVMIRPRGGNFVYTRYEIKSMLQSIDICKNIGVEGIVTGILTEAGDIDNILNRRLTERSYPLEVTFHKAIDATPDLVRSTEMIKQIKGFTRILTSGGAATAMEGAEKINEMIRAAGDKIRIIAAGKVTNENLGVIKRMINTDEFHGRKIVGVLAGK